MPGSGPAGLSTLGTSHTACNGQKRGEIQCETERRESAKDEDLIEIKGVYGSPFLPEIKNKQTNKNMESLL